MGNKQGLSSVRTFFRHCPSCGRRFEIRLVSKKEVTSQAMEEAMPDVGVKAPVMAAASERLGGRLVVQDDTPSIVDVDEFQYTYRCRHCGHEWSEVRTQERVAKAPKGYTGD